MDLGGDEVNAAIQGKNNTPPSHRTNRTKKKARSGKRVYKPTDHDYHRDSDDSRFSQGNAHTDSSESREEKRRNHVKDQLVISQQRQDREVANLWKVKKVEWERDRDVQDLTQDDPSPRHGHRKSFDGVNLAGTAKSQKVIQKMIAQGLYRGVRDEENQTKSSRGDRHGQSNSRGKTHGENSLAALDNGKTGRMLQRDRDQHRHKKQSGRSPLDTALELQSEASGYVGAAAFRSKSNSITEKMGRNVDRIFSCVGSKNGYQSKFGSGSLNTNRRRKQQQHEQQKNRKDPIEMHSHVNNKPIPKKPNSQNESSVTKLNDDVRQNSFSLTEDGGPTDMDEIYKFANSPDGSPHNASSGSSDKRKNRGSLVDEVELASPPKRPSRGGAESPLDVEMMDQDEVEDDGAKSMIEGWNKPAMYDDYAHLNRSRERMGRQNLQYDYDTQLSTYENEAKNSSHPIANFGLTRYNRNSGKKKTKIKAAKKVHSGIDVGNYFRKDTDELVDSDSDHRATNRGRSDSWDRAERRKKVNTDKTRAALKKSGLQVETLTDNEGGMDSLPRIGKRKSPKKRLIKVKTSSQCSVDTEYYRSPLRSRRSRSKSRIEGSTNDNAITIDDSSSDESSIVESPIAINDEPEDAELHSQRSQTRSMRAIGDLLSIDIARVAVGLKVFRSKCALKMQPGTKNPYLLFVFSNESGDSKEIKVLLKEDDLIECAYYLADDEKEESGEYDMSIISFCVKPSEANGLNIFKKSYDGVDDDSGKKFITMELRDREDFQALLVQMKEHPLLKPFCDKPKEFWELDNYTKALVKDDNAEKAKRRTAPPTRSGTKGKALSDSENKLLVVYPFPIEQKKLQSISSMLNELGGNGLGLDIDVIMKDAVADDGNDETDESDRAETGTSARSHYLSIREDDKERLEPGQFLNDTLVDFWMSWISRDHSRNAGPNQVHFFTSHFLTTLQEDGPEGVKSWTINEKRNRKIPIFEKKFIFVPVNGDLHWSLCVIVNPGLIMKAHAVGEMDDDNSREDETADEWPCFLFLDSLRMHKRYRLAKTLRRWLNFEWNRTMNDTDGFIDDPFDDRMAIVSPNVPRQDNGCDCGVFVCRYAYSLYLMRDMVFSFSGVQNHFKKMITNSPAFDFGMEDIARIREEIKVLIDALSPLFYQHKKEEKAMKAAAKREKEESSKAAQEDGAAENVHEKENSPLAVRYASDEEVAL